ncbi:hypothetical protein BDZ89DRAFT_1059585 [Hymenopellis radicata]|nr:hypothetical protein BDZ89DRAFT_1059585 [Hymenopellis radicata]
MALSEPFREHHFQAMQHLKRFTNDPHDTQSLDAAIEEYREVVLILSGEPPARRYRFYGSLGDALIHRARISIYHTPADTSSSQPDLEDAINILSPILQEMKDELADTTMKYPNMSTLELRASILCTPESIAWIGSLLSQCFLIQYRQSGSLGAFEECLNLRFEAVEKTAEGSRELPARLHNLVTVLLQKQEALPVTLRDIDKVVDFARKALTLATHQRPIDLAGLASYHNTLGSALSFRYERYGQRSDLDEAYVSYRTAVNSGTPYEHPHMPLFLANLSSFLIENGSKIDSLPEQVVKESIDACLEALRIFDDNPDIPHGISRSSILSTLHSIFRYKHLILPHDSPVDDLKTALAYIQEAIACCPPHSGTKASLVGNLGGCLATLVPFQQPEVAVEAIRAFEEAQDILDASESNAPHSLTSRAQFLSSFSLSLVVQYRCAAPHDLDILRRAIRMKEEQGLVFIPPANKAEYVWEYASAQYFLKRQEKLATSGALQEDSLADILESLRDGSASSESSTLGRLRCIMLSLKILRESVSSNGNAPRPKLAALYDAYVALLPQIAWVGLSFRERLDTLATGLSEIPSLYDDRLPVGQHARPIGTSRKKLLISIVSDAIQHALVTGRYREALEFIDRGHALFWSEAERVRLSSDAARRATEAATSDASQSTLPSPAIALLTEFQEVAMSFERASTAVAFDSMPDDDPSLAVTELLYQPHYDPMEQESYQHRSREYVSIEQHRLMTRWEELLVEIRAQPLLANFMERRTADAIISRATQLGGPVVVLNASNYGCDAIVLGQSAILRVPLPDISVQQLESLSRVLEARLKDAGLGQREAASEEENYRPAAFVHLFEKPNKDLLQDALRKTTAVLWDDVMKPIVDKLGLTPSEHPGRMWIFPSGHFSGLPIHCAGVHASGKHGECIQDYAIVSYLPSFSSIMEDPTPEPQHVKTLTVRQTRMPKQPPLPGTRREVDSIKGLLQARGHAVFELSENGATIKAVLDASEECHWVHFACHGSQKSANPMDSALRLADGELTLWQLMRPFQNSDESLNKDEDYWEEYQQYRSAPFSSSAKAIYRQKHISVKPTFAFLSACQTSMGDNRHQGEALHMVGGMIFAGYRSIVGTLWSMDDDKGEFVARKVYEAMLGEKGETEQGAPMAAWMPFIHMGI